MLILSFIEVYTWHGRLAHDFCRAATSHFDGARQHCRFAAGFIGEPPMNVFDAGVTRSGDNLRLALANGPALEFPAGEITPAVLNAIGARGTLTLGIRPQAVGVTRGNLKGKVTSNQWLGDQSHIAAEFAGKTIVAVTSARVAARPGDEIPLGFSGSDMHLFDSASGIAIAHGREAA